MYKTVCAAFPDNCQLLDFQSPFLFNTIVMAARELPSFTSSPQQALRFKRAIAASDDWPFLYLEQPAVAAQYLWLMLAVGLLIEGVFVLLQRLHVPSVSRLGFLFLGLGFTLMEASAVVRLALFFGSTWSVSATVFSSVLAMIFCANLLVQRDRAPSLRTAPHGLV